MTTHATIQKQEGRAVDNTRTSVDSRTVSSDAATDNGFSRWCQRRIINSEWPFREKRQAVRRERHQRRRQNLAVTCANSMKSLWANHSGRSWWPRRTLELPLHTSPLMTWTPRVTFSSPRRRRRSPRHLLCSFCYEASTLL